MTWKRIIRLAVDSVGTFIRLVTTRSLHLRRSRLGNKYQLNRGGTYEIFRETVSNMRTNSIPVVLVVGFRLRFFRSNSFLHWVFQRMCILTTPFWSGFNGFHIKLWMVDPGTKNYLGIYEWYGRENAQTYVTTLLRVLTPLSTEYSVWYELKEDKKFEEYLAEHRVKTPRQHKLSLASVLRYYYKALPTRY